MFSVPFIVITFGRYKGPSGRIMLRILALGHYKAHSLSLTALAEVFAADSISKEIEHMFDHFPVRVSPLALQVRGRG